nr:glycoside hydrolase family 5 protein [Rhizomicrobium palustre]
MGGGVNVLGYDPGWGDPSLFRFKSEYFKVIREGGFKHVRIVLQAFQYQDANGNLTPKYLNQLDTFVKAALDAGLTVILDEHDFEFCAKDATTCGVKLNKFWQQIAPRYKDASNRVIFEVLNEPHGVLTAELWNKQLVETLAVIRATNPTRNVIIGPANWNGLDALPSLQLPENDRHIIATFHYYLPMEFTHQGAPWAEPKITALSSIHWGTPEEYKFLSDKFDTAKAWATAHNRPLFLGEFGPYDPAPAEDRVKWTKAVREAAEARGMAWAWWQWDGNFILWDYTKNSFVEPIHSALIPKP